MTNNKNVSNESKKIKILQDAWLQFYNNYLFEKGFISQTEYNKIAVKIKNRASITVS